MSQLSLFALATEKAKWLHARQALVAGNVANANTPGYQAVDMKPFTTFLDKAGETLATTNAAHISLASVESEAVRSMQSDASEATLSGNSVSVENEMAKLGDINRALSLNTGVQRVFHQMIMAAVK
jgi:flagellar basal-body rod protein FlgB